MTGLIILIGLPILIAPLHALDIYLWRIRWFSESPVMPVSHLRWVLAILLAAAICCLYILLGDVPGSYDEATGTFSTVTLGWPLRALGAVLMVYYVLRAFMTLREIRTRKAEHAALDELHKLG